MYHSITIGDKNTWADWRLIPAAPPIITIPPVRKNMVELPGGNGSIDLTQFIGNKTLYGVSEGTWEFVITDQVSHTMMQWRNEIVDYIHGKRFDSIILEDDPYWVYTGRLEVQAVKPGKSYSGITIAYTIDPFKRRMVNGREVTSV